MTHAGESSARRAVRAVLREPLLQFALLAAVPFAVHGAIETDPPREPIVLSDALVDELALRMTERTGGDPTSLDRDALIDGFRREEALYREARRLGLDRGDPIVRRRLVQKLEFLLESEVELPEPDEETLARYHAEHADAFRDEARARFEQVYFGGDDAAGRARAVLDELGPNAEASEVIARGDAFPLGTHHGPLASSAIEARLGPRIARAVAEAPIGRWTGPVGTAWGAHLVRVHERAEERAPPLEAIRERVRRAWMAERRQTALEERVREVIERWPLRREGGEG